MKYETLLLEETEMAAMTSRLAVMTDEGWTGNFPIRNNGSKYYIVLTRTSNHCEDIWNL